MVYRPHHPPPHSIFWQVFQQPASGVLSLSDMTMSWFDPSDREEEGSPIMKNGVQTRIEKHPLNLDHLRRLEADLRGAS
jgi:hypothetical protein